MKICISAEDSFDRRESGGSTLFRNVRTYIVSYSSRRKTSLLPLWKRRVRGGAVG